MKLDSLHPLSCFCHAAHVARLRPAGGPLTKGKRIDYKWSLLFGEDRSASPLPKKTNKQKNKQNKTKAAKKEKIKKNPWCQRNRAELWKWKAVGTFRTFLKSRDGLRRRMTARSLGNASCVWLDSRDKLSSPSVSLQKFSCYARDKSWFVMILLLIG